MGTVKSAISFGTGVYQETGAIGTDGKVDLGKLYLYGQPSEDVEQLHVSATLYNLHEGDKHFVGTLTAHMGPVKKDRKVVYAGVSCDQTPKEMFADPKSTLRADVIVIFQAGTPVWSGPVQSYPKKRKA